MKVVKKKYGRVANRRHGLYHTLARAGGYMAGKAVSYAVRKAKGYGKSMMTRAGKKVLSSVKNIQRSVRGRLSAGSNLHVYRKPQKIGSFSHGVYEGKFKDRRVRKRTDVYNRVGVVNKYEVTGIVTDDNCVYALSDVIRPDDIIFYTVAAVVRKLFEKAGMRVTGFDDRAFNMGVLDSSAGVDDFYLAELKLYNAYTATFSDVVGSYTGLITFTGVVNTFISSFKDYVAQFGQSSASNTLELHSMRLCKMVRDVNGVGTAYVDLADVYLGELEIDVYGRAEMKVQNRTTGAAGAGSAEDVTANPIVGRSYIFNGVPKLKSYGQVSGHTTSDAYLLQVLSASNGLALFGGTNSNMSSTFHTPPEASAFWNCRKSGKQRLDPGNVKSLYGSYHKRMKLLSFLQKCKYSLNNGVYSQTCFPCIMVSFEDVINLDNTIDITLGISVERYLGVYVFEKRQKWMKSNFANVQL